MGCWYLKLASTTEPGIATAYSCTSTTPQSHAPSGMCRLLGLQQGSATPSP